MSNINRFEESRSNEKFHEKGIVTFTLDNAWRDEMFKTSVRLPGLSSLSNSLLECGWGNAYVAIPYNDMIPDELHYDQIAEPEDQEWTFGQRMDLTFNGEKKNYFVLGFDTAHYGQNKENWPESRVVSTIESVVPNIIGLYI